MTHWAAQYIGQKWTEKTDCLYWFGRIKQEQFGRGLPVYALDHARLLWSATRTMAGDIGKQFGYRLTEEPVDGDAVFLTQRAIPHHLGMAVFVNGQLHVLHAVEHSHIVCSNLASLRTNGWKIVEFWTDEPTGKKTHAG